MEIYCMAFFLQFFKKFFLFNIISPEELYVLDQSSSLITEASRLGSQQAQATILRGHRPGLRWRFGGVRAERLPVDRGGSSDSQCQILPPPPKTKDTYLQYFDLTLMIKINIKWNTKIEKLCIFVT